MVPEMTGRKEVDAPQMMVVSQNQEMGWVQFLLENTELPWWYGP